MRMRSEKIPRKVPIGFSFLWRKLIFAIFILAHLRYLKKLCWCSRDTSSSQFNLYVYVHVHILCQICRIEFSEAIYIEGTGVPVLGLAMTLCCIVVKISASPIEHILACFGLLSMLFLCNLPCLGLAYSVLVLAKGTRAAFMMM